MAEIEIVLRDGAEIPVNVPFFDGTNFGDGAYAVEKCYWMHLGARTLHVGFVGVFRLGNEREMLSVDGVVNIRATAREAAEDIGMYLTDGLDGLTEVDLADL